MARAPSAWRAGSRTGDGSACRGGARHRVPATLPQRAAGERQVQFLRLMGVGRIVRVGAEHQHAAGNPLAWDRPTKPDQFGPAVTVEEARADIGGRVGLVPRQRTGAGRYALDQALGGGCRAERRTVEPLEHRKAPRRDGPRRNEIRPALAEHSRRRDAVEQAAGRDRQAFSHRGVAGAALHGHAVRRPDRPGLRSRSVTAAASCTGRSPSARRRDRRALWRRYWSRASASRRASSRPREQPRRRARPRLCPGLGRVPPGRR